MIDTLVSFGEGGTGLGHSGSRAECMHLEARLGAWPKPPTLGDTKSAVKFHLFLGATLSENGEELWTSTETNTGGMAITGYKRRSVGPKWQWQLTHSFASIVSLPREAQGRKIHLHLLPASSCIAAVCANGACFLLSLVDSTAHPLRLSLDHYAPHKSHTLARPMRHERNGAPVDILTHVRFHATRRCITLEHCVISSGPHAAKGSVIVEASLQGVWATCMSHTPHQAVAPSMLQDCAWTGWVHKPASATPGGVFSLGAPPRAATESSMLVALDTVILLIGPAPQRRLQADGAGVRKELWLTQVLDLPVLLAPPLPSLFSSNIDQHPSTDSIPDYHSPSSNSHHLGPSGDSRRISNSGSHTSSSGPPSHPAAHPSASVLSRFLSNNVGTTVLGTSGPSSLPLQGGTSELSTFSSRISALYAKQPPRGSMDLIREANAPLQRRVWILPLASAAGGSAAEDGGQAGQFLVVSPPFVVAVDALGRPDPHHTMLDIPASFRNTQLAGCDLILIDAAVVADKLVIATQAWLLIYEWSSSGTSNTFAGEGTLTHHLELVQHIALSADSFAGRSNVLALCGGARCQHFLLHGPLHVALYVPEATATRGLRLVKRGDMERALQLIKAEAASGRQKPGELPWQQRLIGTAVAECFRKDDWLSALKFFGLAHASAVHPCQLLSAILPALFAGDALADAQPPVLALLSAAKQCVRASVQEHCADQHESVVESFEKILDGPPSPLLMSLASSTTTRRSTLLHKRSHSPFAVTPGSPPFADRSASSAPAPNAHQACTAMAQLLGELLHSHSAATAGAQPGQEHFPRLLQALSAAGELYPNYERGLPGQLQFTQSIEHTMGAQADCAKEASMPLGTPRWRGSRRLDSTNGHALHVSGPEVQGLDYWDWCKAAQIWLLVLTGEWKVLEAVCWRPGLWGGAAGRRIQASETGKQLREFLGDVLVECGQPRAAGLLLAAMGNPARALEVWMDEYDALCSQIGRRHGLLSSGEVSPGSLVPLHQCQALEDHVLASVSATRHSIPHALSHTPSSFSHTPSPSIDGHSSPAAQLHCACMPEDAQQLRAAARSTMLAASAAECMCDPQAVPALSDDLVSWLLRMPTQCTLAVLLTRADLELEDLFSPYHAVSSSGMLPHGSLASVEPPLLVEAQDKVDEVEEEEDEAGYEWDEIKAKEDPAQLWLQIRYLRVILSRSSCSTGGMDGDKKNRGGRTYTAAQLERLWALYMSLLLKLLVGTAGQRRELGGSEHSQHPHYGPQRLQEGFSLDEAWMTAEFMEALRHTNASPALSAMLLPLRPVSIVPAVLSPSQAPLFVWQDALGQTSTQEESSPPDTLADLSSATGPQPGLFGSSHANNDFFPDNPATSKVAASSPMAALFLRALADAPDAALPHVQRTFEELIPRMHSATSEIKQLYVFLLQQQGTPEALAEAVRVLTGHSKPNGTSALPALTLEDLSAVLELVAKHSRGAAASSAPQNSSTGWLWEELVACTSGAVRVLAQYHVQQEQHERGQQGSVPAAGSEEEPLLKLVATNGEAEPRNVPLTDAGSAVVSFVRTVQAKANLSTLERFMHQQCKMSLSRKLVALEDSYVKWNEGSTSMDATAEAEATIWHTTDPPADHRSLPPPGATGGPWCGVCKQPLSQSTSRFSSSRNISWPTGSFLCQNPDCLAAASVAASANSHPTPSSTLSNRCPLLLPSASPDPPQLPPPPTSMSLKLQLSLTPHIPPVSTVPAPAFVAGAVRFGHFWTVLDRGAVCLRRLDAVGGGSTEAPVATAADATVPASSDAPQLPPSPLASAFLPRGCPHHSHVVPNPDNPAIAIVTVSAPAPSVYESFASVGDAASRHSGAPNHAVPRCSISIFHAVDSPAVDTATPAALWLISQRVELASSDMPSSQAVVCSAWGGGGTQALLGTSSGTIMCVDSAGSGPAAAPSQPPSRDRNAAQQSLSSRTAAAVPPCFGALVSLSVVRTAEGEALLLSTAKCLLAIEGQGAVGALRRYNRAPELWAAAVALEAAPAAVHSGRQNSGFTPLSTPRSSAATAPLLAVTQPPTGSTASAAWLYRSVLHTFDVAGSAGVEGCRAGAQLLQGSTYRRASLPEKLAQSVVSLTALPHLTLLLCGESSGSAAQVHAVWRASGRLAYSAQVLEGIGRPVGLAVDPEDPGGSLDSALCVYVLGASGIAQVDVQVPPLAAAWDFMLAGWYTAAMADIQRVVSGSNGLGPVVESAMWCALGNTLISGGQGLQGAAVLGRVLPGVVGEQSKDSIQSFHETVLQFCKPGASGKELRVYLASKLRTLSKHFESDMSVCCVATWLLQLQLQDLHMAQLLAAAAPEARGEPVAVQSHICRFLQEYRHALEYRTVLELLGRLNFPTLLLFAMELYGRHIDAFQMALREMVPKALQLLETIHRSRPDMLQQLVGQLMWHHPIATCTALRAGRSTIDPDLVVSCAHSYAKPSPSPYRQRVQHALRAFLASHVCAGSQSQDLHGLYLRMLALAREEDELIKYIEDAQASSPVDPQSSTAWSLCFDTREALILAQRQGLHKATRALLLLRGDFSAALALSIDISAAADAVSRAPASMHRELWLQFLRQRAASDSTADMASLYEIIAASDGAVQLEDVVVFVAPGGAEGDQTVEGLVGNALERGAAGLDVLDKQLAGFGTRTQERWSTLKQLQGSREGAGIDADKGVCPVCGGFLSQKPKYGLPHGGVLPTTVAFPGAVYHTSCAVDAHVRHMGAREKERWHGLLQALARTPENDAVNGQGNINGRQSTAGQQHMLSQLKVFITGKGDPYLARNLVSKVTDLFGERDAGMEYELLQLPEEAIPFTASLC